MKKSIILSTLLVMGLVMVAGCCSSGKCGRGKAAAPEAALCSGCGEVKGSAKCCK